MSTTFDRIVKNAELIGKQHADNGTAIESFELLEDVLSAPDRRADEYTLVNLIRDCGGLLIFPSLSFWDICDIDLAYHIGAGHPH